jgi:transcriptional regulator with GAF, ATPase, and Fis domain
MSSMQVVLPRREASAAAVPVNVFVASPSSDLRRELKERLGLPRWNVIENTSGAGTLEALRAYDAAGGVLLLDASLPDLEPQELSEMVRERHPQVQVLMLNSHTGQVLSRYSNATQPAVSLMDVVNRNGAVRTWPQNVCRDDSARFGSETQGRLGGMIGESDAMQRAFKMIGMVAPRDTTVLITGESGTGKDLAAQEIYIRSLRKKQPLVIVNCAAIPETLLEAELFGYTKGSFTGAVQARIGRIHAAHGGTLFLDEIGDMPLSLQSKILRFLEQGEVQRLGGNDSLKVDVRVIAATNADLRKLVLEQKFREDLYYRLAIFPIELPPLRDRAGDLKPLAATFVTKFRAGASLSQESLQSLEKHLWPGNVRELRNVIERATIVLGNESEIRPEHILL